MSQVVSTGVVLVKQEDEITPVLVSVQAGFDRPLQTAYLRVFDFAGNSLLNTQLDPEVGKSQLDFSDLLQVAEQHRVLASHAFWQRVSEHVESRAGNLIEEV